MYKATQEDEKIRLEYLKILQSKEKELQKNIKKIEKLIKEQRKNRRFDGLKMEISSRKGKLSWPVMGEVFEKFGRKKVEGFRGIVDKKGIKIRPSIRTVSSVYDGIVIHTDSSWGLGQFIIVEHFGGYYTLYANLADVNVELEQKVKAGEPLGTIDIDHKANTPYLYFEIRKHDKAVDPLVWLSSL
jgi:septal ring factor EnvC (AmiA/AmiB activator)